MLVICPIGGSTPMGHALPLAAAMLTNLFMNTQKCRSGAKLWKTSLHSFRHHNDNEHDSEISCDKYYRSSFPETDEEVSAVKAFIQKKTSIPRSAMVCRPFLPMIDVTKRGTTTFVAMTPMMFPF